MAAATVDEVKVLLRAQTAQFQRDLKKAAAAVKKTDKEMQGAAKGSAAGFKKLGSAIATIGPILAGLGIAAFTRALIDAQLVMDRIGNTLRVATGSAAGAKREFKFVRQEVDRLGLNLEVTAQNFGRMAAAAQGTTLAGQGVRDIFTAVAESASVLGLSAEDTSGVFKALEQIISKGNVSAEELRGQLGERLPGAFQIAARAMGKTTSELDKMLRLGQLAATDLLPKLAAELRKTFGPEVVRASQDLQSAINRLGTAWLDLKLTIVNSGVGQAIKDSFNFGAQVLKDARIAFEGFTEDSKKSAERLRFDLKNADAEVLRITKRLTSLQRVMDEFGFKSPVFERLLEQLTKAEKLASQLRSRLAFLEGGPGPKIEIREPAAIEIPPAVQSALDSINKARQAVGASSLQIAINNARLKIGEEAWRDWGDAIQHALESLDQETRAQAESNRLFEDQINAQKQIQDEILAQAAAETDLIKGLKKEKSELQTLIQAQMKGNRERRIMTIVMREQAKAQAANINLNDEESAALRRKAETLVDLQDKLQDVTEATVDWDEEIKNLNRRAMQQLQDNIIEVARGAKTLGDAFRETARLILNELNKIIVKSIFASNIGGSGGGGGFLGDIFKGIFGLFTGSATPGADFTSANIDTLGHTQGGGRVTAGEAIIGGERRPELFIPDQPGKVMSRIFPSMMPGGGGGDTFVFENNFSIGVAETARREITAAMPQIIDAAVDGMSRKVNLGGREARTVTRKR